jgi:hypothetical protein
MSELVHAIVEDFTPVSTVILCAPLSNEVNNIHVAPLINR